MRTIRLNGVANLPDLLARLVRERGRPAVVKVGGETVAKVTAPGGAPLVTIFNASRFGRVLWAGWQRLCCPEASIRFAAERKVTA
jgi:hypothetical protein